MTKTDFLQRFWIKAYLYPVLAGVCLFLGFERFKLFPVLFVLPFFLNKMRELPLKNKLFAYWLMAIAANVVGYRWITNVAQDYGGLPVVAGWGLLLLYAVFNNLNFVLWGYLERFFGERRNPFLIAALFVVAEQLNPQVFPWYFGSCLDSVLVLYQTADLFGAIGLSFVAMSLLHLPWWLWQNRRTLLNRHRLSLVWAIVFLVFITSYGFMALRKYNNAQNLTKKSVGVTLVQSNTAMEKFYGARMSVDDRFRDFMSLVDFTAAAIEKRHDKVHLLVWPEGAVHFPILNSPRILNEISALAKEHKTHMSAGSGEIGEQNARGRRQYFNTQFVLDPEGQVAGKYRKIILLAFGEYIPFMESLPFLQEWLPETISHFSRGTEKPVFPIGGNIHWLPLICYEDLIPGFIRGFDHKKADFIVNVTNDGWFGKSDASHLHKQMARVRAVEYRKPMLRALNTGTSVVIDAAGRNISRETDLYVRDYINTSLHLPQNPPVTLYALLGDLPIYLLIAMVAGAWLKAWMKNRRQR